VVRRLVRLVLTGALWMYVLVAKRRLATISTAAEETMTVNLICNHSVSITTATDRIMGLR